MVLVGDTIFVAGAGPAPGRVRRNHQISSTPLLIAYSASDGTELSRRQIPAAPAFDGMAVAEGALLITLENQQLLCLGAE